MTPTELAQSVVVEWHKSHSSPVTKQDLTKAKNEIMSVISDLAAKEQADFASIVTSLTALQVGIQRLDDLITALQNSPGGVTPEDAALINQMEAASTAVVSQAQGLVNALPAPPVPVNPIPNPTLSQPGQPGQPTHVPTPVANPYVSKR